jgi:ubiquinone biosynthesis protein UbiJ
MLEVTETSPLSLAQTALRGDKPTIRIEGDVQFAAEINWLVDNVKWDVEEDLARVIGDVPAHTIAKVARTASQALRQFVGSRMGGKKSAEEAATSSNSAPASSAPVAAMPGSDYTQP